MNCKLWLACVYLSESRFGAIQKGVCVCHWRPAGLHAHVPLVKDISSQGVKNQHSLQQEDESVVELDFVKKKKKTQDMARNASHFAAIRPTSRSSEFRQKIQKRNGVGQHTAFFT